MIYRGCGRSQGNICAVGRWLIKVGVKTTYAVGRGLV